MKNVVVFVLISISQLSGCATILNGTNQSIIVLTPPTSEAQCALENDKGKWHINNTPAQILVRRSDKNLVITCTKNEFKKKTISVKPALSNVVYGNMLFGGGIVGGGVDRTNGSAYVYPSEINVHLDAEKKEA